MPEQSLRRIRGIPSATDFNRLARAIESCSRFTIGGLGTDAGLPGGRLISFDRPGPVWAVITGGSGPSYQVSFAARDSSGAWHAIAPAGTAWEVGGKTGLPAGYAVSLRPAFQDQWGFQVVRRGSCQQTVCVTACGTAGVYGATVDVLAGGTTVASCTTGANGCCSFALAAGTYTVHVTYNGTLQYSGSKTLAACSTTTIALGSNSGLVCCGGFMIPQILTLTDGAGSISFVYDPSYFYPIWTGGHSVTLLSSTVTTPNNTCVVATPSYGPVRVCYGMICHSGQNPTFAIQRSWSWVYQPGTLTPGWYQDPTGFAPGQLCFTAPPAICGNPLTDTASFGANPSSTSPFAISGTPVAAPGSATADPIGGSVSIS